MGSIGNHPRFGTPPFGVRTFPLGGRWGGIPFRRAAVRSDSGSAGRPTNQISVPRPHGGTGPTHPKTAQAARNKIGPLTGGAPS